MSAPEPPPAPAPGAGSPGAGSPADEPRWQGMSHQEIYLMVCDGPGAAGSAGAERAWRGAASTLAALQADLDGQSRTLPAGWAGTAADGAHGGLSRLAGWAGQAADGARRTADGLGTQAGLAAELRVRMPVPASAAPPDVAPSGPADPSLLADWAAADTSAGNGAQRAAELMQRYTEDSREVGASFGGWGPPPTVTVVVAAGGVGPAGPGVAVAAPGANAAAAPPPSGTGAAGGTAGGIAAGATGAAAGAVTAGAASGGRRRTLSPGADVRTGGGSPAVAPSAGAPRTTAGGTAPGAAPAAPTGAAASGGAAPGPAAAGPPTSGSPPPGQATPGSAPAGSDGARTGAGNGATSPPGGAGGPAGGAGRPVPSGAAHRPPSGRHLTSGQRGPSGPTGGAGAGQHAERTRRPPRDRSSAASAQQRTETGPATTTPPGAHSAADVGATPGHGIAARHGVGQGIAVGHLPPGSAAVLPGGAPTGAPGENPVMPMSPGAGVAPGVPGRVTRPPAWRAMADRHAADAGALPAATHPDISNVLHPGGTGPGPAPGHVRPAGPSSDEDGAETPAPEDTGPAAPPVLRPENPWRHRG